MSGHLSQLAVGCYKSYPGYSTFTMCGKHHVDGNEWTKTLNEEIKYFELMKERNESSSILKKIKELNIKLCKESNERHEEFIQKIHKKIDNLKNYISPMDSWNISAKVTENGQDIETFQSSKHLFSFLEKKLIWQSDYCVEINFA